jgi:hypothetical protein
LHVPGREGLTRSQSTARRDDNNDNYGDELHLQAGRAAAQLSGGPLAQRACTPLQEESFFLATNDEKEFEGWTMETQRVVLSAAKQRSAAPRRQCVRPGHDAVGVAARASALSPADPAAAVVARQAHDASGAAHGDLVRSSRGGGAFGGGSGCC